MRRLVLALALAVPASGCAGKLDKRVDQAEVAMVALDVLVEDLAPRWRAYVEAQVARCKAQELTTKAEGVACLGPAAKAKEVEDALQALTQGQAATHEALKALREVAPLLEQARSSNP